MKWLVKKPDASGGGYEIWETQSKPQQAICQVPDSFGKEHAPFLSVSGLPDKPMCVFDEEAFAVSRDNQLAKDLEFQKKLLDARDHNETGVFDRIKDGIFGSFFELVGGMIVKSLIDRFRK